MWPRTIDFNLHDSQVQPSRRTIKYILETNYAQRLLMLKMIRNLLQLGVSFLMLASAAADEACAPTSCGNVTNITSPFFFPSLQAPACGVHGFELNCTDLSLPILRISPDNHQYVIENISYSDRTLRVYDAALLTFNPNTTCLPEITNTTLRTYISSFSRFSLYSSTRLHLFPLCLRNLTRDLWPYRVICSVQDDDEIMNLAIGEDDDPVALRSAIQNCERHIVAPVDFGSDNIYTRLRRGFQIQWKTGDVLLEPSLSPTGSTTGDSQFEPSLPPTTANFKAPPPLPTPQVPRQGKGSRLLPLVTGVCVATLMLVVSSVALIFYRKKWLKLLATGKENGENQVDIELYLKLHGNLAPKRYKYSQLKKITNSLSENLGKGGYGSVYKGKLKDGRFVAVKILSESKGNGQEFINEVSSISRTSHVNVVALLGFCFEGPKRALVYEFMPNGSLDKFIPNTSSSTPKTLLGLSKLFEIAVGIARGLEYLHQGCSTRILHFDIKPHNILLDKDFKPKISDFGLSKLCPNRSSIVSMQGARGTAGYIAPEVFCRNFGEVSHKSDVYSYGMMVLEMVVGRQNNIVPQGGRSSEINFSDWIYKNLEQNTIEEDILDNNVTHGDERNFVKRRLIIIGLWCIQTDPKNRPSISRVLEMLEADLESLSLPPRSNLSLSQLAVPISWDSESHPLQLIN